MNEAPAVPSKQWTGQSEKWLPGKTCRSFAAKIFRQRDGFRFTKSVTPAAIFLAPAIARGPSSAKSSWRLRASSALTVLLPLILLFSPLFCETYTVWLTDATHNSTSSWQYRQNWTLTKGNLGLEPRFPSN